MRPMGEGLIVVFLVGCLVTAMAVAGEQEGKKDAEILSPLWPF
jgi:hypothetical protein